MTQTAPVAVVVPVYNRRLKLIKTLESVAAQSSLPRIVVVVDDGSSDGTAAAAETWLAANAPFVWKVVRHAVNAGVSVARNTGFEHIGELPFVCFLNSDDLWPPDFIAEGLRALARREDAVAAIANRVADKADRPKRVKDLRPVVANPLLWVICHHGAILSCSMIRSSAARAAGLFPPEMLASEDTDFLLRLFVLGGAVHSESGPVVFVKGAPLEATEPPNLSDPSPDLRYLWTCHLEGSISRLPAPVFKQHEQVIRAKMAHRWAAVALLNRETRKQKQAFDSLLRALRWDHSSSRRLRLLWSFLWGTKGVMAHYRTPN